MLLKKGLLSTLPIALILGFSAQTADADIHKRHHPRTQAEYGKLHPACKKYLDRRAAWYKYKGNRAELKKNRKARKATGTEIQTRLLREAAVRNIKQWSED